jgi:hypothetical protein
MKKMILSLYLGLMSAGMLQAQSNGVCGNGADQQALQERLQANLLTSEQSAGVSDRSVVKYVPIHFHLVGDANGAGRLREGRVLEQLCDLNEAFANQDIQFYFNPHPTYGLFDKSISNNNVYNQQTSTFTMQTRRHANALNVYVVNLAESGNNTGTGVTLAYYSIPNDWVVSRKDEINGNNNGTLPHEIGHFFSLMHTFYGWEENPFDPTDAGWPIAPVISPGGVPTERQNGSNCTTAADMICDTPPDYNFGLLQSNCAPYTGGAKDPLGTLVDPMENNFLGYFQGCGANYVFTPLQAGAILSDLNSPQRNYLDNNYNPPALTINTPANTLVSPAAAAVTTYYDEVLLDWNNVVGATYYLLEIDVSSTFNTPLVQTYVLTETSFLATNLQANKTYQWRIRPFNEYYTCAAPAASSFKTSLLSATKQIENLNAWQIAPNPVQAGQSVQIMLDAADAITADVQLLDASGRLVKQMNQQFIPAGSSNIEMSLQGVQNGLYLLVLQGEKGRDVRKLSVIK